jgi:hypothetical protein
VRLNDDPARRRGDSGRVDHQAGLVSGGRPGGSLGRSRPIRQGGSVAETRVLELFEGPIFKEAWS